MPKDTMPEDAVAEAGAEEEKTAGSKRAKLISTVLVFGAIALLIWQIITPLPLFLQPIANITAVVLIIHAVEGLVSASLILRYRLTLEKTVLQPHRQPHHQPHNILSQKLPANTPLAVLKAGLYAFFVGTVGLLEVIEATRPIEKQS